MSGLVVSIVGVGAGFATCHSDAKFRSGTGQVRGEVKMQQLVSKEASVGGSATEEGPIATILKPPFQISMSFSLKTLLSALFCIPCRMVAVVLYTQTHPPAACFGERKRESESVEFRPLIRATVRACCSRTSSWARFWCSRVRSQPVRLSQSML